MHGAERLSRAEWRHIELLRNASPAQRATLARSLSRMTLALARRAVREAHPDATQDELHVHYVAATCGQELARRFKQYLVDQRGRRAT